MAHPNHDRSPTAMAALGYGGLEPSKLNPPSVGP